MNITTDQACEIFTITDVDRKKVKNVVHAFKCIFNDLKFTIMKKHGSYIATLKLKSLDMITSTAIILIGMSLEALFANETFNGPGFYVVYLTSVYLVLRTNDTVNLEKLIETLHYMQHDIQYHIADTTIEIELCGVNPLMSQLLLSYFTIVEQIFS
jgi:hypothetical protein